MAEKEKVQLPATGGGLFRPSDAEGRGIKIRPEHIIIASGAIVVIEIILHAFV
ncbi:TPA: preprotein translocase subunit Sec61beta [archaeon]|uniref:Preprotein translocase subunit Sec61beta n=1 Tax=Candidatus Naiadarchaeum limnaeum TaxID=2756139 RepID=A0A832V028_9ARCH|nr:preprotein translocase subunit Sec61beta [Candidatus Naiadarchaeales archaeon SRR2090153.bin1042]HIK00439.1 preprotein translocase subunit Sec61beta [Candidatus Naiadarchaeum limnaeum]